jgi:tetratricopeptide (TPR) repeat protein
MEKDELLDIVDKTEDRRQKIEARSQRAVICDRYPCPFKEKNIPTMDSGQRTRFTKICFLLSVFCLLSSVLSFSCSLPRIIVFDDPLTSEEHINLGVAYEKKGELDNAIEEFKKASKKLPVAYLYLGNAYMQKGDIVEAEKYYRKAIKKQPDLADAYNNLAWLYYTKKENLEEAERLALKALDLVPSNENYKDTLNKIRELKNTKQ